MKFKDLPDHLVPPNVRKNRAIAKYKKLPKGGLHADYYGSRPEEVEWALFIIEQGKLGVNAMEILYKLQNRKALSRGKSWSDSTIRNIIERAKANDWKFPFSPCKCSYCAKLKGGTRSAVPPLSS